jgi:hypothetical protein
LCDVEFNHVVKTRDAKTFLDVADGSDEFRQRPGKIKTLDDHELGNISDARLAVRVHENAEAQSAFLKILKFSAPHHAEEQHDARF